MVKLSIITITYNNEETIGIYLESLQKNLPSDSEIIIIDNYSQDNTVKIIKDFKGINLIENKENLGFAKGNNLAAAKAKGEYIMFLNPDTKVKRNIFDTLIRYAQDHPEVGIVAPKLILPNGDPQFSVRKLPTIWGAIKDYYLNIKNSYEPFTPSSKLPVEVESVYGAAILLKKKVFFKVGGFDEKYFMYFEDLDLCLKMKRLGLKVVYFPEATIIHLVGHSQSEKKNAWLKESAKKYHGVLKYLVLDLILRLRP